MSFLVDKNPQNPEEATEMFKKVAEAYETLIDANKRREYDISLSSPFHSYQSSPRQSYSKSSRGSHFHHDRFSRDRAFDIFNSFFRDMDDFQSQFFSDSFGSRDPFRHHRSMMSAFDSPFMRDPFDDDFFSARGDPFGGMMGTSSSRSYSSVSYGTGSTQKSTSTSTVIESDGTKRIRTETTIIHPDGRRESNVDERVEQPSNGRTRLEYNRTGDDRSLQVNRPSGRSSRK